MEDQPKYKEQIDALLKEAFYEEWMGDSWNDMLDEILSQPGTSYEEIADAVDEGMANNSSLTVESQFELFRDVFKQLNNGKLPHTLL